MPTLISPHEVRLLLAIRERADRWVTNGELAEAAGCSARTARLHTDRLVALGVLEERRLFPAPVFRLKAEVDGASREYLDRVEQAREAMGL